MRTLLIFHIKSDHGYEHAISATCIQTALGMHILGVSISLQRGEQAYTIATTGVVVALDIFWRLQNHTSGERSQLGKAFLNSSVLAHDDTNSDAMYQYFLFLPESPSGAVDKMEVWSRYQSAESATQ
jgi:hypothetical protein